MRAWGWACGSASVAGLSLLFALNQRGEVGAGILAAGALSLWAASRWPGLQLVLIVALSAVAALQGLPVLWLVTVVVLALMSHQFAQGSKRYQDIPDVDPGLLALQRRHVLSLGAVAWASGVLGLAWHVQVGFWGALALALALLAILTSVLRRPPA